MEIIQYIQKILLAATLLFASTECAVIRRNSNIEWLKDKHWPETHLLEQLHTEENHDQPPQKLVLITYLPRTTEKSYCQGTLKAIWRNIKQESIGEIHLFRHNESCINENYLPTSPKIKLHRMENGQDLTFADIMKFVAKECEGKNVILARANMYLPNGINIFARVGIKDNEVHVLKSEHPNKNHKSDAYYGTHYALILKGQWDMTDDYPNGLINLDFEIDNPKLDSENVLKRIFEVNLQMTLVSSDIKAICLHDE